MTAPVPETVELDLRGLKCPLPALLTRKALKAAAAGTRLVVTCTDPMAVIDIPHLAQETGAALEERTVAEGLLTFILRKPG
ncbi:sulfurtransferase TusA family protein [Xanthobacter oligotrophicus]|uniref:sulfurtransferase TusA family protein n=1 Tax=Xanthobacter oligotrophicus TaxID=2607286 RepID=UPI0011F19457|nr:sulfurtransferase TusA family protein [Xanthobacter oligotrophicus]MCG5233678.1 sulfurtransferase TusA family protein [Xanthobacter oligotrophicus]